MAAISHSSLCVNGIADAGNADIDIDVDFDFGTGFGAGFGTGFGAGFDFKGIDNADSADNVDDVVDFVDIDVFMLIALPPLTLALALAFAFVPHFQVAVSVPDAYAIHSGLRTPH